MDVSMSADHARLSETEVTFFLVEHGAWDVVDGALCRSFTFDSFGAAIGFVTAVAIEAERMNHHPDIDIRWTTVRISLTTHDAGGLTSKDTHLAAAMDALA